MRRLEVLITEKEYNSELIVAKCQSMFHNSGIKIRRNNDLKSPGGDDISTTASLVVSIYTIDPKNSQTGSG